jgi:hypothetical protein
LGSASVLKIQPRINANERESEEDQTKELANCEEHSEFISTLDFQGVFILRLPFSDSRSFALIRG